MKLGLMLLPISYEEYVNFNVAPSVSVHICAYSHLGECIRSVVYVCVNASACIRKSE